MRETIRGMMAPGRAKSSLMTIMVFPFLFIIVFLLACSPPRREAKVNAVSAPPAAVPSSGPAPDAFPAAETRNAVESPVPPAVGEGIAVPPVELGNDDVVIMYKHDHHAYLEVYGFDTEVFRFRKNAEGKLRDVSVGKRLMDGEVAMDGIEFLHMEAGIKLRSVFHGKGESDCLIEGSGHSLKAVGKDFSYSYFAPDGQGMRIERRHGQRVYVEEWNRGGDCLVSDTKGPGATGRFEGAWPRPGRYIERPADDPSGGGDTEYEFFDIEGGIKFRSSSAEPLGEGAVLNLGKAFPNGLDLETVAILDIVLGEGRRITPLLARIYLGAR